MLLLSNNEPELEYIQHIHKHVYEYTDKKNNKIMKKIFIVHYKKLTERKTYLEKVLSNFDFEFIEKFDRESILDFDTLYSDDKSLWEERTNGIYNFNITYSKIRDSEFCNSLSHIEAMKNIVEQNLEYAIILEDDVIIGDDFSAKIEEIIKNIPKDFDFVFFGTSFSKKILDNATFDDSVNFSGNLWKKKLGSTRTVDAYVVSNKAAQILIDNIKEIVLPFDFELNYFFRKLKMEVYWYDPGFIKQGSQSGHYSSSIR